MEKQYTYENCTVIVRLPKNQETVRQATERFLKDIERTKK